MDANNILDINSFSLGIKNSLNYTGVLIPLIAQEYIIDMAKSSVTVPYSSLLFNAFGASVKYFTLKSYEMSTAAKV